MEQPLGGSHPRACHASQSAWSLLARGGKAAQPRSSEKNAASRAGQTPCARWAVGICYTIALKSETAENRAFEEKARLDAVLSSEGTGGACAHVCCLFTRWISRPLDMDRHCTDLDPTICGGGRRPRSTVDGGRRPRSAKGRDRRRPKAGVGACRASRARTRAEEAPIRVRKGPFDPPLCVSPLGDNSSCCKKLFCKTRAKKGLKTALQKKRVRR